MSGTAQVRLTAAALPPISQPPQSQTRVRFKIAVATAQDKRMTASPYGAAPVQGLTDPT